MALAASIGRQLSNQLFKHKACLYTGVKCYATDKSRIPWNHLWIPEEYNKENHAKHAEKYHMHPDDYKPYDPFEKATGDYPALPMIGPEAKDPLHDEFFKMSEDRYSYGRKFYIEPDRAFLLYIVFVSIIGVILYLASPYPVVFLPNSERQYPYKGKTHYTFEPVE
ncbi:hypothetical protein DMN91_007765 [Ooceraea biroi]|uniref:NADH dehydrogenase [ubiquinone] 1 beta subcomplex subunit 8, mitochondrial n=1 Tax=Ooceraea biroi TaxID=2015173 RepID=A0A3L8DH64_OOCBI|nr:hypothetical protein DMN91_007765 [Ooceraea biroi]